jgi:hypothetical protein
MLFGHNTNVNVGSDVVHVQTEDRGANHAFIDTTVHWKGRILHRRTHHYTDLLPLDGEREATLRGRLDEQHRAVIDEIRSGALQLVLPVSPVVPPVAAAAPKPQSVPTSLKIELLNAKTWLAGRHATLQLKVLDGAGQPVAGAEVKARVEGAEDAKDHLAIAGTAGEAMLQFEMPRLTGAEVALVIEAAHHGAKGNLRFQLRAKPRV